MKTVAILGATAHIAKSLLFLFSIRNLPYRLVLFTRRPDVLARFIAESVTDSDRQRCRICNGYETFSEHSYDAIINCVGVGTLGKHKGDYSAYFTVYEKFDNLAIDYLRTRPETIYVAMGSGAVYGSSFEHPADGSTEVQFKVNGLSPQDSYSVSRVYSEAKHRALAELRIVDLRIFSFFSRFYDPADGYLVNQMIEAVRSRTAFVTDSSDFYRDYIHPSDLCDAVTAIIGQTAAENRAFDLCSTDPVTKSDLIGFFSQDYGMQVHRNENSGQASATGQKKNYFSTYRLPLAGGVKPRYSSLQAIADEAKAALG